MLFVVWFSASVVYNINNKGQQIIKDLKTGEISEDVQALFDEISAGIQGGEADTEEIDVADEDEEAAAPAEEPVEEAAEETPA